MEPILGEGGIIVPPDSYFETLVKILKERDIPFISDEVQSGFGRTGKLFAGDHWNLKPDLMTLAKGLGGGMPIGATVVTPTIVECVQSGDFFSTYGGNPVCSAVALENINILYDEKLIDNSLKLGKTLFDKLEDLQKRFSLIGDVRGKGLMLGIELVSDLETKKPASEQAKLIVNHLKNDGVIIGLGGLYGNVLRFQPPLCISEEQIDIVLEKLAIALKI